MSTLRTLCVLVAPVALQALAAGQTLHAGWLKEILDVDRDAAVRTYRAVAADTDQPAEWRALALARLVELEAEPARELTRRLEPIGPDLLTDAVRAELRRRTRDARQRATARQAFLEAAEPGDTTPPGRERLRLLAPRSLSRALARTARENLGPSGRQRLRYELLQDLREARAAGDESRVRSVQAALRHLRTRPLPARRRMYALQLLEDVLAGRDQQAALFRRLHLGGDPAPPPNRRPEPALEQARRNLERELRRQELLPRERRALRALAERLREKAEAGLHAEGIELLRGLDLYGWRLLRRRSR